MDTNLKIPDGLDAGAVNLARAIRKRESGGDYNKSGDSGSSLGAYQWNNQPNGKSVPLQKGELPSNFVSWAKEANLDPTDFSPNNQDMVAYNKIKKLKDAGHNVLDIAAIWNGGDPKRQDPNYVTSSGLPSQKKGVYDVPAYANAVNDYYQELKSKTNGQTSNPTQEAPASRKTFAEEIGNQNTRQQMIDAGQPVSVNPENTEPTWAGKQISGLLGLGAGFVASGKALGQDIMGVPETDLKSKYLGDVPKIGKGFDITSFKPESVKGALSAAKTGVELGLATEGEGAYNLAK